MMILRDIGEYGCGKFSTPEQINASTMNIPFDDLFLSLLGKKYRTKQTAKIGLRLFPLGTITIGDFKIPKRIAIVQIDIVEYWRDFDFDSYFKMDRQNQKLFYWKVMCECVLDIAEQLQWDVEPLKSIYERGLPRLAEIR